MRWKARPGRAPAAVGVNSGKAAGQVARVAEGDPLPPAEQEVAPGPAVALRSLYTAERPRLARLFARRVRSDEADDLVQETFARFAAVDPERRRAILRPEAFLTRVAMNLVRNLAVRDRRRSAALHVPIDTVEPAGTDQQAALEARDMLRRLEAAVQQLKPLTREIFLAHRLDGYTYAEIAQRTGLSVKGVEKQMSRAIAHIDRKLGLP